MQYGQALDRIPIQWAEKAVQLWGSRHQEEGQQLRQRPDALSAGLTVIPNPRGPGPVEVPLEERVLPPL